MGQPTRPLSAITYAQMVEYESRDTKWFTFHGYVTNLCELASIFKINHVTFLHRLDSGWGIEAALVTPATGGFNKNAAVYIQSMQTTHDSVTKIMNDYFNPKNTKNKKGGVRG